MACRSGGLVQERLRSLLDPPGAFAHRGAGRTPPRTRSRAFRLALRLGATGLESDVWLTSDGGPVLDHDGVVQVGLRKRSTSRQRRAAGAHPDAGGVIEPAPETATCRST